MANRILQTILAGKIARFRSEFLDESEAIFFDPTGKLIHPGEFGTYREKICKSFLYSFIPSDRAISTGFILDNAGNVSHQCDLVIFDKSHTPVFTDDRAQNFFPIETVSAVGEVKSNPTKKEFKEALLRLAFLKQMRCKVQSPAIYRDPCLLGKKVDFKENFYDQIVTFLICRDIKFDIEDFLQDDQSYYSKVDYRNRVNMIYILNKGVIAYKESNEKFFYYPHAFGKELPLFFKQAPEIEGIFGAYLFASITASSVFHVDLVNYIS